MKKNRKRNNSLLIRLDDVEYNILKTKCELLGMSYVDFFSSVIMNSRMVENEKGKIEFINIVEKKDFSNIINLINEINKIGININQIAKAINTDVKTNNSYDNKMIEKALEKHNEVLEAVSKYLFR